MADLTTVADVQAYLSLPTGQDAALLQSLVTNASALVLSIVSRDLLSRSYNETRNGRDTTAVQTLGFPITAVASVTVDGQVIPPAASATAAGYMFSDTAIYLRGYCFTHGVQNITLNYIAGLAAVPADLAQACIEIVSTKYKRRTDLHVSGKTLNGETISFTMADIPASAKLALNNYKRVVMPS